MNGLSAVGLEAKPGGEGRAAEILAELGVDSAPAQTLWMVSVQTADHDEAVRATISRLDETSEDWRDSLTVLELPTE